MVKCKGVQGMQVGRAGKYKNVTLDRLYTENLNLKAKLKEIEDKRKKLIELNSKILQNI